MTGGRGGSGSGGGSAARAGGCCTSCASWSSGLPRRSSNGMSGDGAGGARGAGGAGGRRTSCCRRCRSAALPRSACWRLSSSRRCWSCHLSGATTLNRRPWPGLARPHRSLQLGLSGSAARPKRVSRSLNGQQARLASEAPQPGPSVQQAGSPRRLAALLSAAASRYVRSHQLKGHQLAAHLARLRRGRVKERLSPVSSRF